MLVFGMQVCTHMPLFIVAFLEHFVKNWLFHQVV